MKTEEPMRRLNRLIPVVCVIGVLGYSAPVATRQPDTPRVVTPAPDVLYAAPGDLNYSYGPKGAALAALTAGDRPATATFSVTYNGFSPDAQTAFQAAINIWAATITSPVPIRIVANWTPLGSGILGSAGASASCAMPDGFATSLFAAAVADKINGSAFCASQAGADREIDANFNSAFTDWEFGTTGVGVPAKYNFMTVVLHEVGHGLGLFGGFTSSGGIGSVGSNLPYRYDRVARTGLDGRALITIQRPSAELHTQLVSNNTFWTSPVGPKLETHDMTTQYGFSSDHGWLQGSSYSHLDDVTYTGTPNGLMTFRLSSNEVYTDVGPLLRSILTNVGWTVSATARIPGDFDGNGTADFAVCRPSRGLCFVANGTSGPFGEVGDIPVPADFNGDGRTEFAFFRPSTGVWVADEQTLNIGFGRAGDIPVPGDYDGDGRDETALFRSTDHASAMTWIVNNGATTTFGLRGDIAVPADYDGDGKTDLAVYRPRTGQWLVLNSSTGTTTTTAWGMPGDIPVPGKYDGDARTDLAVFRPSTGTWYLVLSLGGTETVGFGLAGDVPMPLDVNGDGQAELTVFRPSDGNWFAYNRQAATFTTLPFGLPGDIPVMQRPRLPSAPVSDFDGDGVSDVTVFRPSSGTWFTKYSSTGFTTSADVPWGMNGDTRVAGDYDGDHRTDYAVYRPSTHEWFIRRSSDATLLYLKWGSAAEDIPLAADYDGDGRTDIAIYRPSTGTWFVLRSSANYRSASERQLGVAGDLPIVGDFDGDGKTDLTVYRPSNGTWTILRSASDPPPIVRQWGLSGDIPSAGDFDGDGRTDLNVYRPSTGTWFAQDALLSSPLLNGPSALRWGLSSDTPVSHDFDGDGAADPAVFRPSTGEWFVRRSSDGTQMIIPWGLSADGPLLRKDGVIRR